MLIVTEIRSEKQKTHSAVPPTIPVITRAPGGGESAKWILTIARWSSGTEMAGTSAFALQAGTAKNYRIATLHHLFTVEKFQFTDPPAFKSDPQQPLPELHAAAMIRDKAQGRIDERSRKSGRGDAGPARFPAAPQRPEQNRRDQLRSRFLRFAVQRCQQNGPEHAPPQHVVAWRSFAEVRAPDPISGRNEK